MQKTQKIQKAMYWAVLVSETSHVFCCVLPTLFSIASLLAGVGFVATMPGWMGAFHDKLHAWEMPLIALSGFIVALGWGLHVYSRKIDCHDTGCHHGPCEPRKNKSEKILIVATLLFLVNVSVYTIFHRSGIALQPEAYDISPVHGAHEH